MPRCTDLQSILILGSGSVVIGQAAEFDCRGTHGVRALREEGGRVAPGGAERGGCPGRMP